jgi:signal transduction histidine kinase
VSAKKDGTPFYAEIALNRVSMQGESFLQAIVRDVTERREAEQERERLTAQIREQARQMSQVLATVPAGVVLLDAERRLLKANPVAEQEMAALLKAEEGGILSKLGDRLLADLLTSPPTRGLWHEVKAAHGVFEVLARPVENGPEPERWVMVIKDVTQEREIRRQLRQQERLAAVGQLASGIAHDFNNIMAVIVLYAQMELYTPNLSEKSREHLQTIARQAKRATDLIQQILDFSRSAMLERRPLDLAPFLKEVVKLLERTVPENIAIDLNVDGEEYVVNVDPTRVQQAVMNLVLNARDAMPEGGELCIDLSRTSPAEEIRCTDCGEITGGEWVQVAVTDTGAGIPSDVLPRIFEPFFTTKEVGQGTGLGLAQVYGIVKQHEGHIDVVTHNGSGTTFSLYLPPLTVYQPPSAVEELPMHVRGQGEVILVVEDNVTLRRALLETLRGLNYRVLEAANGREALQILAQEHDVVLVLSDLVMPGMGGQALFHAMRRRRLMQPVVMLSGHPMENELESLQAEGLTGWLLKPIRQEELAKMVARVLRGG